METMRTESVKWGLAEVQEFLRHRHPGQRQVNPDRVRRVADLIKRGDWWWPSSPLTVGFPSGYSLDGHNRATAIELALSEMPEGSRVDVAVAYVPDRAVHDLGDVGARTIAQELKYRFPTGKNLTSVAALLPLCMSLERGGAIKIHGKPFARTDMMDYAEGNYDRLSEVTVFAHRIACMDSLSGRDGRNRQGIVTSRTLGIVLWDSWESSGVQEFWTAYGQGNIAHGARDPRAEMMHYFSDPQNRYKLGRGSQSRFQVAWTIASLAEAWNAAAQGRKWEPWDEKDASLGVPLVTSCRERRAA